MNQTVPWVELSLFNYERNDLGGGGFKLGIDLFHGQYTYLSFYTINDKSSRTILINQIFIFRVQTNVAIIIVAGNIFMNFPLRMTLMEKTNSNNIIVLDLIKFLDFYITFICCWFLFLCFNDYSYYILYRYILARFSHLLQISGTGTSRIKKLLEF